MIQVILSSDCLVYFLRQLTLKIAHLFVYVAPTLQHYPAAADEGLWRGSSGANAAQCCAGRRPAGRRHTFATPPLDVSLSEIQTNNHRVFQKAF